MRSFNPEAKPGLRSANFRKICENGFGDRNNSYAHSMTWFQDHLYVGTHRAHYCLVRKSNIHKIDVWPVECLHPASSPEFEKTQLRAEIWRYNPPKDLWERVEQAPIIVDRNGDEISREFSYRGMIVFQGKSDKKPVLYTSNMARSTSPGVIIMRSENGKDFVPVSKPGLVGLLTNSLRTFVSFKGRLFTAPTSAIKGNPNMSSIPVVYESSDPANGEWQPVNEPGWGDLKNQTIFELRGFGDYLYAGTINNNGFQIWRTKAEGKPPYDWTNIITNGAGRGRLNQGCCSMAVFKNALYVGTGIQHGGYDRINQIGPAGAEIIRIYENGTWEVVVGEKRNGKRPLSGMSAGFNSVSNGYIWKMCVRDDWLYAGTFNWTVAASFTKFENRTDKIARLVGKVGIENIFQHQGGCELWRTYDGENWLPVTRQGFGNPYNYGFRNMVSTPYGLFIGTANPYGPRVAKRIDDQWTYIDNPDGGLEVWLGK